MKYCPTCNKTYPADWNVCPADQSVLQSSHELRPGMVIRNKYEILQEIGVGGMGIVYRGRHITFNELCAIKVLNDQIAGDKNFLQRFQTEAVVTRKLRHPNAVRVDDFDYTDDGRPFIVMELVDGRNLGEILQVEGPIAVKRAVRIAAQVARALGAAHKLGFVHRDIKPGNIILAIDERGEEIAKVLDFGIAKLRQSAGEASSGMTMTGMVVGTPLYMSPEQFMGKQAGEIDGRTDIYSLGVVLYQMVTGRVPFDGDTPYTLMMQHMEGKVLSPTELAPGLHIPPGLSQVILKAIDKSRDLRYQNADEFVAALEGAFAEAVSASQMPITSSSNAFSVPIESEGLPGPSPVSTAPFTAAKPAPRSVPGIPVPDTAGANPPKSQAVPSSAVPVADVSSTSTEPQLPKSIEQHVFVQQRTSGLRNLGIMAILILALGLIAGLVYIQRGRTERSVVGALRQAQSKTLRSSAIQVSVSYLGQVTLAGNVTNASDAVAAEGLAHSVFGVTRVSNRLTVISDGAVPSNSSQQQAETSDSLVNKGQTAMDLGEYDSAIAYFTQAANDPNNKTAKDLLAAAQRAKKTEEELLKTRTH